MKNRSDNFIMSILIFIMVIIFLGTVYFCLDVFGIIQVPVQYSIASLFYSQIEVIVASENSSENIIVNNSLDIKDKIIEFVKNDTNSIEVSSGNVENPLDKLQENQNNTNPNSEVPNNIQEYDSNRFYYNQLNEYGKILYDKLYQNAEHLKSGNYTVDYGTAFNDLLQQENGEDVLSNALDSAVNALILDNPEFFYIDITKMYLLTNITTRVFSTTYSVSIGSNGGSYLESDFNSEQDVLDAMYDVETIKNNIISQANGNTIEKIKVVHDYLVGTVEYDKSAGNAIYDSYGALINRRAVCEGYAKAFKYILDDMGIPCIIVCGTGTNSKNITESHAWNYVLIDGNWYAMDVTWDDPVITGNVTDAEIPDDIKYAYFLKGSEEFFKNHIEDKKLLGEVILSYPELSTINY